MLRLLSWAGFVSLFLVSTLGLSAQTLMTHHQAKPVRDVSLPIVGRLPKDQVLKLDVVLPLRDQAGLDAFLSHVTNPHDPLFRRFVNPTEFAEKFGPTQSDYDTTVAFLKDNGFNVYGGTFLGHEIQVTAPVSVIEAAFHVNLTVYQHPTESRTFYMPDREPTTSLPFPLWHITGLDNFSIPKPKMVSRDQYAAAHGGRQPENVQPRGGSSGGSGPAGAFLGSDMRAAYYGTGPLTGAGQTVGLFEYDGMDLDDLTLYFQGAGQTNDVPITLRSSDGLSISCVEPKCDDSEQELDMSQALGMAPGLANLIMFIGNSDTAIIADMTTHYPLSTSIGCSWGWGPDAATLDPYFQQMAAQGQNFLAASGDYSTWTKSGNSEAWPADDAWLVSVGGTDLVTSSPAGPWSSETTWSDSGGGSSPDAIPIPIWQTAVGIITTTSGGSTTLRDGPDVAANANFTFYACGDQIACTSNYWGGTSFAAPMWAGFLALANQQLQQNGGSSVGFINPLIYAENLNPATYAADFHDITIGQSGSYSANTGFDLVTGWGSPTAALIPTLVGSSITTPFFFFTDSPVNTYTGVIPGTTITEAVAVTSRYGFTGPVALTCAATGNMTCTVTPATVTLTSNATVTTPVVTINTSAVTAKGTYAATVTGTSSSLTEKLAISVAAVAPSTTASFSIASASANLTPSPSTTTFTDNITATSLNSFAGVVTYTCTAPGYITCSFTTPTSTVAAGVPGSTTLTLVSSAVTFAGTYNVIVTGTSGTLTSSVTIPVTVILPDFAMSSTTTQIIPSGNTFTAPLSMSSLNSFAGIVNLSCSSASGITCTFNPPTVTLKAGGTGSAVVTMDSAGVFGAGAYGVFITATSGTLIHTVPITVIVETHAIILTPGQPITIASQGASGSTSLTVTSGGGFSGAVNLSCSVTSSPSGATYLPTCSTTTPITANPTTPGSGTLTINTTAQTLSVVHTQPSAWLGGGLLFALLLLPSPRRRWSMLALLFVCALVIGSISGCSSGSSAVNQSQKTPTYTGGTTLGTYVVTVTASASGVVNQTSAVAVTIQ